MKIKSLAFAAFLVLITISGCKSASTSTGGVGGISGVGGTTIGEDTGVGGQCEETSGIAGAETSSIINECGVE